MSGLGCGFAIGGWRRMHAEGNREHVVYLREEERGCFQVPSPGWERREEIERSVLYFFSLAGRACR